MSELRDTIEVALNFVKKKEVRVTAFGAVGDGSKDDTKAIQAACDVASILKAPVVLPAGNFVVKDVILTGTGFHIK